jgi:hypothetical protein
MSQNGSSILQYLPSANSSNERLKPMVRALLLIHVIQGKGNLRRPAAARSICNRLSRPQSEFEPIEQGGGFLLILLIGRPIEEAARKPSTYCRRCTYGEHEESPSLLAQSFIVSRSIHQWLQLSNGYPNAL